MKHLQKSRPVNSSRLRTARRFSQLYLLMIPALVYIIIFNYIPMYGAQIAFKNFSGSLGIWHSPWIGWRHFQRFLVYPDFWQLIRNTLGINIYSVIVGFPFPILLALMINEVHSRIFRKSVQMVTYMPHFISTVAMCGMITIFLQRENGLFNIIGARFGLEPVAWMTSPDLFKSIYVWSGIWQGTGYGSIIYLAALSGIDQNIIEAARVDGANRLQRIWHIDCQCLVPIMIIQLILRAGSMLSVGFEKIMLLQNDLNLPASDVISTYVYRNGLLGGQFSYTSAIGLFNSLINFILLISVNQIARKYSETSI
jgi:putative aldouronate transport system permease protein